MTTIRSATRAAAIALCVLSLGACGTAAVKPATPSLQELLAQASQASAAGNKEQAVTLWRQGAAAYPADKAPWAGIAQTRYDAGQYGEAILGAQEVLVRDPNDQLANSIIAISGLRLSTRALGDLSRQNNLSGSLRTESQDLAKLLRESLGETVLVPVAPGRAAPLADRGKAAAPAAGARKPGAKAAETNPSADPFSTLK
jgi:tetratricopeptide (TPR) repeat protein